MRTGYDTGNMQEMQQGMVQFGLALSPFADLDGMGLTFDGSLADPGGLAPRAPDTLLGQGAAQSAPIAVADVRKFSDYIFKPGATHGKTAVFDSLGYSRNDSQLLADEWMRQAAQKYASGDYTLGKLDQYGQRINITIQLRGIGQASDKVSNMVSGWMIQSDGSIKLNTPFSGFAD